MSDERDPQGIDADSHGSERSSNDSVERVGASPSGSEETTVGSRRSQSKEAERRVARAAGEDELDDDGFADGEDAFDENDDFDEGEDEDLDDEDLDDEDLDEGDDEDLDEGDDEDLDESDDEDLDEDDDQDQDELEDDELDELDELDEVEEEEAAGETTTRGRRYPLGPTLVGLGGGIWAIVAVLRCSGPPAPATPPMSMEQPDPEPAMSRPGELSPEAPEPEPAQTQKLPRTRDRDEDAAEPAPVEGSDPRPEAAPWAKDLERPLRVTYTIQRGGSMKNVANLFKIFHHEIQELNPTLDLEQEQPPGTPIVVYEGDPDEPSESVGTPSGGSLVGGVPMLPGPGRRLMAIGWKRWATAQNVALLDRVLEQWAERGSSVQPILVGNMSSRKGGRLDPHSTHQSGRDIDLGYLQILPAGEELNWREMNERNLDAGETWALIKLLAQTGRLEVIYVDRSIQKLLYEHALKHGTVSKSSLSRWMEYPNPTGHGSPVLRHVRGHIDHMHVRFACRPEEKRCESRD